MLDGEAVVNFFFIGLTCLTFLSPPAHQSIFFVLYVYTCVILFNHIKQTSGHRFLKPLLPLSKAMNFTYLFIHLGFSFNSK